MISIRRYGMRDRAAVREICCDTAYAGKPVENIFPDREVAADLVTRYYTDFEPQSAWVAESDRRVVGYITGCLDTRKFLRAMWWPIGPAAFARALARGCLWHPQTVRLLRVNLGPWLRSGYRTSVSLDDYPAHLHVNVRDGFRGQHVGQQLMEKFFEYSRAAGVRGIHAGVSAGNEGGCRFFEAMGFVPLCREARFRSPDDPQPFATKGWGLETVIYGKKL